MTFNCVIEPDYRRLISAINCDSTAVISAIKNASGNAIEAYNEAQATQITATVLVYGVWTEQGNLAGFFALQTGITPVAVLFEQFRSNFQSVLPQIQSFISNFINEGTFYFDKLQ